MSQRIQSPRLDVILILRQHLEKDLMPVNSDPLKYWKTKCDEKQIQTLVKKYFCVPASSCESERVFSKAGQIVSERRTRLSPSVVNNILFLNKNNHLNLED